MLIFRISEIFFFLKCVIFFYNRNKNLEDHIASLDTDLKSTTTDLYATKEKLSYYKSENRNLHDEMTVVNQVHIK